MRTLFDVPAPAKLNLFLHVTGRRPDGYHLLQSAIMLIDWCDTLHFELRTNAELTRADLGPALPADDLILQAARALQQASGCAQGAHIQVDKRIPAEAGLGGGSSNAATTLLALNQLWQLSLSHKQLAEIGLSLGADVPFFLYGRNAWIEGIGEPLRPLQLPPEQIVVIKPPSGLSTGTIFADPQLKRDTNPAILSVFAAEPFGFGQNDLQPVAMRLDPHVRQGLELLSSLGLDAKMTGSGSAIFALASKQDAERISRRLPSGWIMRLCKNMQQHPLQGWAAGEF